MARADNLGLTGPLWGLALTGTHVICVACVANSPYLLHVCAEPQKCTFIGSYAETDLIIMG